ncbi:serine/threonine protein kinase [Actinomadura macra]|uniref:serine/threonine protein kinase n=1 Tax=Actinomadura macra TaxID=46164 RepID=UPI0008333A5B|nr:serine/threonine-protein kinase [Actinomadura macra]
MPEALPLQPGDPRRLGAYEITGRLGVGEQGAVFLGRDAAGGVVAVKLLHVRLSGEPVARSRFASSFTKARKVSGFCTAAILDADVEGDRPYVVSEWVDGPSLQQLVDEEGVRGGAVVERLAVGTAVAIAAVHRAGALHHDVKPGNVLLGRSGPRMSDFGIARALEAVNATPAGRVTEDPTYKAPEQLSGQGIGPAADVFAWASTMLFAVTGKPPFGEDSPSEIMQRIVYDDPDLSAVPDSLREVMADAFAKSPSERPSARRILKRLLEESGDLIDRMPASMVEEGRALAAGATSSPDQAPKPPAPAAAPPATPLADGPSPSAGPASAGSVRAAGSSAPSKGANGPLASAGRPAAGLGDASAESEVGGIGSAPPPVGPPQRSPMGAPPSASAEPGVPSPTSPLAPPDPLSPPSSNPPSGTFDGPRPRGSAFSNASYAEALGQPMPGAVFPSSPPPRTTPPHPASPPSGASQPSWTRPPKNEPSATDLDPAAFEPTATFGAVTSEASAATTAFDALGSAPDQTTAFESIDLQGPAGHTEPTRQSAPHLIPGLRPPGESGEHQSPVALALGRLRRPSNHVLGVALSLTIGVGVGIAIITLVLWPQLKADDTGPPPDQTNASDNRPVTTIPASFAGTWKGTVVNTNRNVSFPIEVTFETGGTTARAVYPRENCTGTLTLSKGTEASLNMNLAVPKPCTSGTVRVSRQPDGTLQYTWSRPGTQLGYSGRLSRG